MITDVYAAGEAPIEGATGQALAAAIESHGHRHVEYVASRDELARRLVAESEAGDVVVALGAGDINRVLGPVDELLRARLASTGGA